MDKAAQAGLLSGRRLGGGGRGRGRREMVEVVVGLEGRGGWWLVAAVGMCGGRRRVWVMVGWVVVRMRGGDMADGDDLVVEM